ncbi:MAG: hypothetical protein QOE89_1848 [Pseudonocardiales bacterium]|nr:hypothetical protein [Pseudonocardiales bacterium]
MCCSLDGLPLAIELAAARTKALSVQEIARHIDDRFGLLSDPTSRRPERYRALATAIGWSYDLLFPDEQRGPCALACFSGGAPVAAAEGVVGTLGIPAASALDVIVRLADRSLVAVDIGTAGAVRYRLTLSLIGWNEAGADVARARAESERAVQLADSSTMQLRIHARRTGDRVQPSTGRQPHVSRFEAWSRSGSDVPRTPLVLAGSGVRGSWAGQLSVRWSSWCARSVRTNSLCGHWGEVWRDRGAQAGTPERDCHGDEPEAPRDVAGEVGEAGGL